MGYLSRQTPEPFFPGLTKHLEDLNKMLIPYVMLSGQGINLAHTARGRPRLAAARGAADVGTRRGTLGFCAA